eukprot:TRINITY_DN167_c0_g1_i1.p1 TRINITY_DN167_c0_g1~~TRINITY_DN167_c0_g1_i1.p1  ORF type:complete len:508 (-),score=184.91 TRINITY_DN167_c0_g1_i1:179-1636(-)
MTSVPTDFPTQLFINNEFVNAKSGKTFAVVNPATEQVIGHFQEGGPEDVDLAVQAARKAFKAGSWRHLTGSQRASLLHKLANLIEEDIKRLTILESMDNGKPVELAHGDIQDCVATLRYFAGYADKIHGSTFRLSSKLRGETQLEPYGVCGLITPWNYPLLMAIWKFAPAIAAGNTIVLKPSEKTPITCLELGKLVKKAGFPPGVFNVVTGAGATGGALSGHKDVDRIAFTGSGPTGRKVLHASADSNLKMATLELGGKSPLIIFADCNIDAAVEGAHEAIFFNMGQNCCAGSRLYVEKSIYEEFVQRSVERLALMSVGDPLDPDSTFGPVVDELQMNRILGFFEKAKEQKANLAAGGKRMDRKGYYIEPTIYRDVDDHLTIAQEEIFGPVLCIMKPFETLDEVVERANNTCYGLAAGVFTNDVHKVEEVVPRLKAGTVWVNSYNTGSPGMPFGGMKESGFGRDLGEEAIYEYVQCKSVFYTNFL